jgi:hypothetical protein
MASGDILFPFSPSMICGPKLGYQPTASIQRVGSGNQLVAVMPKVTSAPNPCFDIKGVLPHLYSAATGLTIVMAFACDVNSGNVKINAAFERYNAAGMGLGAESFAAAQTATVAVADRFRVTVTGRADVVVGVGAWKLVDASGESFFLETVPQSVDPGPPSFSFEVQTVRPPASGAASLVYVCSTALSRNYSAAAKALVTVTPDWTSASAAEMAEYQERFRRKLAEVIPVHVEVLLRFCQETEAAFGLNGGGLSATIET